MILKSNSTTRRLEGYARARGLDLGIARVDENSAGLFFVVTKDGQPLVHWISLGWGREEATERIERMAAGV